MKNPFVGSGLEFFLSLAVRGNPYYDGWIKMKGKGRWIGVKCEFKRQQCCPCPVHELIKVIVALFGFL